MASTVVDKWDLFIDGTRVAGSSDDKVNNEKDPVVCGLVELGSIRLFTSPPRKWVSSSKKRRRMR